MKSQQGDRQILLSLFSFLEKRQRLEFGVVLGILALSAALAQYTPLAIGYLTDHVLAADRIPLPTVIPLLLSILAVNVLNEVIDEFSESLVLAEDYFRIAGIPRDFSYQPALPAPAAAGSGIRLQGVSFAYPEKPADLILRQVDLEIRPGSFVGIAGPSGCGKSTLIKLIARLEPCTGGILLDGRPLESFSRSELAGRVALVPQVPFLIADTVYHNICYGLRRSVSAEEVREAARRACLEEVIDALPGQYDFPISEGGGNLSGGQRQRIALARIFLRRPEILILDEATSALDNTSERLIQQEIERLKQECGTTILSIAHRLTTLRNCDEILVMDRGQIVQRGSYEALKAVPGIFRDMERGILK